MPKLDARLDDVLVPTGLGGEVGYSYLLVIDEYSSKITLVGSESANNGLDV